MFRRRARIPRRGRAQGSFLNAGAQPGRAEAATGALWCWVAAFLASRAAVIAFGFDGVFFWEESYRLLVAEALRGGWPIPLTELQADRYAGGSLVFAALTAVVTLVTGPTLLAVKTVALLWNAAGLVAWLLFADRCFGRRAAHALGLLWLAAPPVFVVFNVVGQGFHSDTVTLWGLQLVLLLRYLSLPTGRRLAAWAFVCGLSIWFCYTAALMIAVQAAYAVTAGALPPRRWPRALAFLAIGLLPWLAYSTGSGGTLGIVSETFAAPASTWFATLADLVAHGVAVALYFRDLTLAGLEIPRELLSYPWLAIYSACFVAASLPFLRSLTGRTGWAQRAAGSKPGQIAAAARESVAAHPELVVLSVFPLFLVVIAASNQGFNDYGAVRFFSFRVLVPALAGALLTIALAASRSRGALGVLTLAVCTLLGAAGFLTVLRDGSAGLARQEGRARELGAEAMGHLIVFKHGIVPVHRAVIAGMPPELRAIAYRGVGFSFAYLYATKREGSPASNLTTALLAIEPGYRVDALSGARIALGSGMEQIAPLPASPRRDELAAAVERAALAPRDAPSGAELGSIPRSQRLL